MRVTRHLFCARNLARETRHGKHALSNVWRHSMRTCMLPVEVIRGRRRQEKEKKKKKKKKKNRFCASRRYCGVASAERLCFEENGKVIENIGKIAARRNISQKRGNTFHAHT